MAGCKEAGIFFIFMDKFYAFSCVLLVLLFFISAESGGEGMQVDFWKLKVAIDIFSVLKVFLGT